MTRLLALSDIHDALPAVRELARVESPNYTAIIVAGDIGGSTAKEFFRILTAFGCPILYVYGNWDWQLAYDECFGEKTMHLHTANAVAGELLVSGFSGCETQWGQNPAWIAAEDETANAHRYVVEQLRSAKSSDEKRRAEISDWYEATKAEVTARTRDRRKRSFREKMTALDLKRRRRILAECTELDKVRSSKLHAHYEESRKATLRHVLEANRTLVVERIRHPIGILRARLLFLMSDCFGCPRAFRV